MYSSFLELLSDLNFKTFTIDHFHALFSSSCVYFVCFLKRYVVLMVKLQACQNKRSYEVRKSTECENLNICAVYQCVSVCLNGNRHQKEK